jgi:hypothetical protein
MPLTIDLDYKPQPRQRLLHETSARQMLYGGAAGGGKSHAVRWDAIACCLNNPGMDAFLFRRTTKNLEKNHINSLKRELPKELGSFNETRKVWEFPNGSILHMCYCETDADLENYQGAEFHWLGIDEAGQFTQFQIVYLRARVRLGKYHVRISAKPIKYQSWTLTSKQAITYYEYKVTCHSKADPKKFPVCKGNSNGTVCYHCLAAIKDRVGRRDKQLSLPENGEFNSAVKLLNFGGQLVKIVNQNGKAVWGTVR